LLGLTRLGTNLLNLLDNLHTLGDVTEDAVLTVQPVGLNGAEEELGTVGVGALVSHGENTLTSVLKVEVLVLELLTVDGLTTGAVVVGEVTTLAHELGDNPVEGGTLVTETLLTGTELPEVLLGPGNNILPQGHLDPTLRPTADGHVEEDNGILHFL